MKRILLMVACVIGMYTTTFAQEECEGPLTVTIQGSSTEDALDAEETAVNQPTCNGPTGSITIQITGGSPDYSVQWQKDGEDYSTEQNLSDIGNGEYTAVVTDASGCTVDLGPFTITEPDAIDIVGTDLSPTCNTEGNDPDGSISLAISGGAGNFTFSWTTVGGSGLDPAAQDQTGLSAGVYTVVVTDADNCTATAEFTLTAPDPFTASLDGSDPTCNVEGEAPNGSLEVTLSGGNAEFTYVWSTEDGDGLEEGTASQSGLSAGTYTVVVTDDNGCTASAEYTLSAPELFSLSLSKLDPTCNADDADGDGSIAVTISGGTGAYTYSWTTDGGSGLVDGDSDQSGLSGGEYTLVVSDENGCEVSESITLEEPTAITLDVAQVDPSCGGTQDGSITVNGIDGPSGTDIDSYSFNWNTDGGSGIVTTGTSQSDLSPGLYLVTVTDDNTGCSTEITYDLTAPEAIVLSVDTANDPSCNPANGEADGTISVSATGGSGDFTYAWSSDNEADLTDGATSQSDLPAGTYTVVVTDTNGCSSEEEITLTEPVAIDLEHTVVPPTCEGGNGSIWIAISPEDDENTYTYNWTGSGITQGEKHQTNLAPGTYNLTVTNQNGCTETGEYIVPDVEGFTVSADATADILCNGDESGEITVTASGGTGDLEYSIDGGDTYQSENVFSGLGAGEYTITIRDGNGCTTEVDATLDQPEALTAGTCTEAQDLCNASEGEIKVQASGGVGPYTVTWSSPDGGTLDQEELEITEAGGSVTFTSAVGGKTYSFIVTDANGCQIP